MASVTDPGASHTTRLSQEEADLRLLAMLREDARSRVSKLAIALRVSRTTIYNRIARLEEDGTIAGYTVRMGADYDLRMIRAHVMIKVFPKVTFETQEQLAAMPEVAGLYAISGEHDLIAIVEAPHANRLNDLIDAIGMLEGVEKTTSSIILATKLQR